MDCTGLVETLLSFKNFAVRLIMVKLFLFFQSESENNTLALVVQQWPLLFLNVFLFFYAETEELNLEDGQWEDVHVITGALKLFFRELPEPLFPFSHFDAFISAISENFT